MAYWPTQLPKPKLDGYSLAPQAAFARTDMDAGPARQRRRFLVCDDRKVGTRDDRLDRGELHGHSPLASR